MDELNKSKTKQSERYESDAWNLVETGITLVEASSILLHLINVTMKNYSVVASHFAVVGKPVISATQPETDLISNSQYQEIIEFLELSKKVSASFSSMTLTIADAVGEDRFQNQSLITSLRTVNLTTIEMKFHKIFLELSHYVEKICPDKYFLIFSNLTILMDQHTQNLRAGRNTVHAAEKLLGAALNAQRTLESAVLGRL